MGRAHPARGRHPVTRQPADRADLRPPAGRFHAVGLIPRLSDRRADPVASRHVRGPARRQPAGRRRTPETTARSDAGRRTSRTVAGPAGRRGTVRANARQPVAAGSRLHPRERADVLRRRTARGQDRPRDSRHVSRRPRWAAVDARRRGRDRVRGAPGERQPLLRERRLRDRRQGAGTRAAGAVRVQQRWTRLFRDASGSN